MLISTRRIKSRLEFSTFPLRLALPPAPVWRRRRTTPGPGAGQPLPEEGREGDGALDGRLGNKARLHLVRVADDQRS
jgi:hypothetical protein